MPTRLRTPSVRSMASNSSIRSAASGRSVSSASRAQRPRVQASRASSRTSPAPRGMRPWTKPLRSSAPRYLRLRPSRARLPLPLSHPLGHQATPHARAPSVPRPQVAPLEAAHPRLLRRGLSKRPSLSSACTRSRPPRAVHQPWMRDDDSACGVRQYNISFLHPPRPQQPQRTHRLDDAPPTHAPRRAPRALPRLHHNTLPRVWDGYGVRGHLRRLALSPTLALSLSPAAHARLLLNCSRAGHPRPQHEQPRFGLQHDLRAASVRPPDTLPRCARVGCARSPTSVRPRGGGAEPGQPWSHDGQGAPGADARGGMVHRGAVLPAAVAPWVSGGVCLWQECVRGKRQRGRRRGAARSAPRAPAAGSAVALAGIRRGATAGGPARPGGRRDVDGTCSRVRRVLRVLRAVGDDRAGVAGCL
ncbi:hypothetical protein K438DRAFT_87732 [Mycena galopus ATCC 62051]|nr:hypothetical protein K438DRAFT_87732 [Mycena galopus ATCC 62051]